MKSQKWKVKITILFKKSENESINTYQLPPPTRKAPPVSQTMTGRGSWFESGKFWCRFFCLLYNLEKEPIAHPLQRAHEQLGKGNPHHHLPPFGMKKDHGTKKLAKGTQGFAWRLSSKLTEFQNCTDLSPKPAKYQPDSAKLWCNNIFYQRAQAHSYYNQIIFRNTIPEINQRGRTPLHSSHGLAVIIAMESSQLIIMPLTSLIAVPVKRHGGSLLSRVSWISPTRWWFWTSKPIFA